MASAGRKLTWAVIGLSIYMVAAACAGGVADSSANCQALDALSVEIEAYEELLVWPGITAAPLQEATDELEAVVLELVAGVSDEEDAAEITEALALVAEAVSSTIPAILCELRPEEPAQMDAGFISV